MKYVSDILKQFALPQRLMVLIIILSTIVLIQYLKTDDCRPIIDENIKMHKDFVTLSEMLRKRNLSDLEMATSGDTEAYATEDTIVVVNDMTLEMLEIIESNIK